MSLKTAIAAFLAEAPLLSKHRFEFPKYFSGLEPDVVELFCESCGTRRPYRDTRPRGMGAGRRAPSELSSGVYRMQFACQGCRSSAAVFFLQISIEEGWIRKLGQLPPWSIEISSDLARELGPEDADLVRKARICLSQSFGIGACAYLRRVLENQVDAILELLISALEAEGSDSSDIEAVKDGKAADEKMRVAYQHAPTSIVVEGHNPLKLLHDQFSVGLHRLPEDDATDTALKLLHTLEFVVVELARQRDARAKFSADVRGLSSTSDA